MRNAGNAAKESNTTKIADLGKEAKLSNSTKMEVVRFPCMVSGAEKQEWYGELFRLLLETRQEFDLGPGQGSRLQARI